MDLDSYVHCVQIHPQNLSPSNELLLNQILYFTKIPHEIILQMVPRVNELLMVPGAHKRKEHELCCDNFKHLLTLNCHLGKVYA